MSESSSAADLLMKWMEDNDYIVDVKFIPWSKSRNAKPRVESISEYSLEYEVTVSKRGTVGRQHMVQYGMGVGHAPSYKMIGGPDKHVLLQECETGFPCGMQESGIVGVKSNDRIMPEVDDVMYCIAADIESADGLTFEEFCSEMGLDTDSRKAERIYNECRHTAKRMRRVLEKDYDEFMRLALATNQ